MNSIFFNNKNAFEGISYTPFVSYLLESDGYISSKETIELNGEIISDCISGISGVFAKQKKLVENFSKNYSKFEIKEDSKTIFFCDYASVKSIDFEDSDYSYIIPYSIKIDCYEKDFFSGNFGVYDIKNEFIFAESDDQLVDIEHSISAKGFNNKNSAIYNAVNWVYSHTGLLNMPSTQFISMNNGNTPILVGIEERIDRFDGTCSFTEKYSFDQSTTGQGIVRYTVDIKKEKDKFNIVDIKGSVDMGIYGSISAARNRFSQLDLYSLASHIYRKATLLNDLSAIPLTNSINEDLTKNILNFEVKYNNDNSPIIKIESSASITKGYDLSRPNSQANLTTKISSRNGIISKRYDDVHDYFTDNFNPISEFIKNMPTSIIPYDLSLFRHENDNVKYNKKLGTIEYTCSWSIKPLNVILPCYIKSINLIREIGPKLDEYNFIQPLCPDWVAIPKGYKWAYTSVQGDVTVYPGNEAAAIDWVKNSFQGQGTLTSNTESTSPGEGKASFEYKWEVLG